jgi:hypothetical protein
MQLSVRSSVGARHIDHISGHDVTEWDPWHVELATEWRPVTNLLFVPLTVFKPAAAFLPGSSETSVGLSAYQATRRHIPEDSHLFATVRTWTLAHTFPAGQAERYSRLETGFLHYVAVLPCIESWPKTVHFSCLIFAFFPPSVIFI